MPYYRKLLLWYGCSLYPLGVVVFRFHFLFIIFIPLLRRRRQWQHMQVRYGVWGAYLHGMDGRINDGVLFYFIFDSMRGVYGGVSALSTWDVYLFMAYFMPTFLVSCLI